MITVTKLIRVAVYSSLFLLAGCSKTLDFRNAEISNNKIFESGANTGFSGKITNLPLNKMPVSRILTITNLVGKISKDKTLAIALAGNALTAISGNDFGQIICDATTSDGFLDGEAICQVKQGHEPIFKFNFNKNTLDGEIIIYDLNHNEKVIAKASYKNGELDGLSEIYSSATGKIIHNINWIKGISSGTEEQFDESTGKMIFQGNLKNGVYDGVVTKYSPEGDVTEKKTWISGVPQAEYSNKPVNTDNNQGCVDLWSDKHRKEAGPDTMISQDQITEWTGWCNEGKLP